MAKIAKFANVTKDTPRLVVMFKQTGQQENFQWGMIGEMPILSLIGQIIRVQGELPMMEPGDPLYNCPERALVLAWDNDGRKFSWFVHADIPVTALVGMLETIKMTILGTHMARQVANQQVILGPDGQPARR